MTDLTELNVLHAATTQGFRKADMSSWYEGVALEIEDHPPIIAWNAHPGNYVNPPLWKRVALFESVADRDFAIAAHSAWPDIYRELTEARKRLARLEKIATRLVEAYRLRPVEVAAALDETIDRSGNLLGWLRELESETKKAGA